MEELYTQNFKCFLEGEPDCMTYKGAYRNEKRHGNGRSEYKDGSVYDGEWRSDLRNGFGLMCYPDGSTYEGEWKKNLKHGFGVYLYSNGDKYEGQWHNGLRHGIGTYIHSEDECSFYGTWKKGQRIGPAEIRNKHYRFHTNWMINKPVGVSAFTFNCNTMMTGYMDTANPNVEQCSNNDFQWHTQEISKYDRTKLPAEPELHQAADMSDDESIHADPDSLDESGANESTKLEKVNEDDLYANANTTAKSVVTNMDEVIQV